MSSVPFVGLQAEHRALESELMAATARVVRHASFVLGSEVAEFESAVAEFLGVPHAVGVSSGTDALLVAMSASGVRPGDLVVTTPLSFFATVESIFRVGAIPRFVDVNPTTLELDAGSLDAALSDGARAIVPVHLYGHCDGIAELVKLASSRGVAVIEDAAQAFGSRSSGRAAGTWGSVGCFSFFPAKVLGALGDGGLVVTRDQATANGLRALRQHGLTEKGHVTLGGNFRLDALQAAYLSVKLRHLPARIERRRRIAAQYEDALRTLEGLVCFEVAREDWNGALYTVRVLGARREALRGHLSERGIETRVYYPRLLHQEPALAERHGRLRFPGAETLSEEVLSLPLHPFLTDEQVAAVIEGVRSFWGPS